MESERDFTEGNEGKEGVGDGRLRRVRVCPPAPPGARCPGSTQMRLIGFGEVERLD